MTKKIPRGYAVSWNGSLKNFVPHLFKRSTVGCHYMSMQRCIKLSTRCVTILKKTKQRRISNTRLLSFLAYTLWRVVNVINLSDKYPKWPNWRGCVGKNAHPSWMCHRLWGNEDQEGLSLLADTTAPRVAHTWYRMHGCVVHRGIKTVGREPSWCRLNSEYQKALAPFFIPSLGSK